MRYKVGEQVAIYIGSQWEDAEVVSKPEHMSTKRGTVFVKSLVDGDIYRYNKEWVRSKNV